MKETATSLLWRAALALTVIAGLAILVYHKQVSAVADQVWSVLVRVALVAGIAVAGLAGSWLLLAIGRFALAPAAAKRHYPMMIGAALRWPRLTRVLGLAYPDPRRKVVRRGAIGPHLTPHTRVEYAKGRFRHPRARFRADVYGILARVRTTGKTGRAEFEKHAQHIADEWRCIRVQVAQTKPGYLTVRGIRQDPLVVPLSPADVPPAVYSDPFRLYLGRDEWGAHRFFELAERTGITVTGLQGYGKTEEVIGWLWQLAPSGAVQFVFIDGRGGGDYLPWQDRAWLYCGHDLKEAAGTWKQVEGLMRRRLDNVGVIPGPRNRWLVGPTSDYPLIVTVVDECHEFFDLETRGRSEGREAEQLVRQCRQSAGALTREGRSTLFLNIYMTQKQTSDATPTFIRDTCQFGVSFATRTRDAAVAGLGEHIKDYPSYCPTALQDPAYVGVCTAGLLTGADPFVRLRVPHITEGAADERAAATAHLRRDPDELLGALLEEISGPGLAAA